jgi:hypothetical protein
LKSVCLHFEINFRTADEVLKTVDKPIYSTKKGRINDVQSMCKNREGEERERRKEKESQSICSRVRTSIDDVH